MPALTPHYAPVLHVRRARGQVGMLQAGTVTRLSAASSKLCYFMMLFFPSEWFLFKFQSLAFPLPFSFFFSCFAWLCLWSRIGPGIKMVLEKETAFPDFCILHLSRQLLKGPLSWPAGLLLDGRHIYL